MCPPRYHEICNVSARPRVNEWLDTSLCCIVSFYQHRVNNRVLCDECYNDNDFPSNHLYENVSRHYVHIGHGELFETCYQCDVILPRNRAARDCITCRTALNDFIEYLQYSNDRPYDCDEPTVLMISTIRHQHIASI